MSKKEELKKVIEHFETGQSDFNTAMLAVKKLTGKEISQYSLEYYWTYTSLSDFCDELLTETIEDWQDIDDSKALLLIKEIFEKITQSGIISRNAEALEKRYNKPEGFVMELIFAASGLENENEILQQLKKENTIYL